MSNTMPTFKNGRQVYDCSKYLNISPPLYVIIKSSVALNKYKLEYNNSIEYE